MFVPSWDMSFAPSWEKGCNSGAATTCSMCHAVLATIPPALAGLAAIVRLSAQHSTACPLPCSHRRIWGCYTPGSSLWTWESKWKNEMAVETLCGVTLDVVMIHSDRKKRGNKELQYKATANQDSLFLMKIFQFCLGSTNCSCLIYNLILSAQVTLLPRGT